MADDLFLLGLKQRRAALRGSLLSPFCTSGRRGEHQVTAFYYLPTTIFPSVSHVAACGWGFGPTVHSLLYSAISTSIVTVSSLPLLGWGR